MTEETLRVVRDGLDGRPGARTRVVVLGAGLAGLVAAYELKQQGHEVVVLEAQNRVGGRVLTCRRDFAPGLCAEFGAMRIPRSHDLTVKYCAKFNLPLVPFVMGNAKALVYLGGQRMTVEEAQRSPAAPVRSRATRARQNGRPVVDGGDRRHQGAARP